MQKTSKKTSRVLLGKFWLDVHDRGIRHIAFALRDAGMEVIYVNYRTVEELVNTAIQEDIDCIGLSYLAGGEDYDVPMILEMLKKNGMGYVPVVLGGVMPPDKPKKFIEMGVKKYFGPGSDTHELVESIRNLCHSR